MFSVDTGFHDDYRGEQGEELSTWLKPELFTWPRPKARRRSVRLENL